MALLPSCLAAQGTWGVLKAAEGHPVFYSFEKIAPSTKLIAYRMDDFSSAGRILVKRGTKTEASPLIHSDGTSSVWRHEVRRLRWPVSNTPWLCLSGKWRLVRKSAYQADILRKGKQIGSVSITPKTEGVDLEVDVGERHEEAYLALGYDLQ